MSSTSEFPSFKIRTLYDSSLWPSSEISFTENNSLSLVLVLDNPIRAVLSVKLIDSTLHASRCPLVSQTPSHTRVRPELFLEVGRPNGWSMFIEHGRWATHVYWGSGDWVDQWIVVVNRLINLFLWKGEKKALILSRKWLNAILVFAIVLFSLSLLLLSDGVHEPCKMKRVVKWKQYIIHTGLELELKLVWVKLGKGPIP